MPSCYQHGANLCVGNHNGSIVQGLSYKRVLVDWYEGRNELPHILLDDCNARLGTNDPCNPLCNCSA